MVTNKQIEKTADFQASVGTFAMKLQAAQERGYLGNMCGDIPRERFTAYQEDLLCAATRVSEKYGKYFVRVDLDRSGRYMVDADGNIFGIKAYGVVNLGRQYGTLDTIAKYDWTGHHAVKIIA
jgi:hypothetical protein